MWVKIEESPVTRESYLARLEDRGQGAVVSFSGVVRDNEKGKRLRGLQYDCYREMAEKVLSETGEAVIRKFNLVDLVAFHRVGFLGPGETSFFVAVSSEHRKEAFGACSEFVDLVKTKAPIWKKDIFLEGGESWH